MELITEFSQTLTTSPEAAGMGLIAGVLVMLLKKLPAGIYKWVKALLIAVGEKLKTRG